MRTNLIRALVVSAALAAASGPVFAQPAPPPPGEDGGPRLDVGSGRLDPATRAEMRAQHLRDVLQLRPNQEAALAELTAAMKPPEGARERMRGERGEWARLSTPERLDKRHEAMVRRQQEFDRRAMAIKKFYAQLTPSQQKAFDAMQPMDGHGGRMGGHRGGPGGGWGHGDKGPGDRGPGGEG